MKGLLLAVSPAERRLARQMFVSCPQHALRAGTVLSELDPWNVKLLVVDEGIVALVTAAGSQQTVIALARQGDLLAPPTREEQIRALTDARLIAVSPDAYERLLGIPGVARALLESLLEALDQRQQSLAGTRGTHAERLQETLYRLARDYGRVCTEGVEIDLPLTHELLGQMVGSARETVSGTLARFQREGLLVRNGRTYRLSVAPHILECGAEDRQVLPRVAARP
jgi:CRP-like cAMP-binding protein